MSKWKKVSLISALIVLAFLTLYKFYFSMDVVEPYEVTVQNPKHQLLIASQGSDYKNAVVTGVIEALKDKPVSVNVVDVSGLSSINLDDWSAIVILHTWENWAPQSDAKQFLEDKPDHSKLIILTTSGDGDLKMDGVDAITSASKKSDIPVHTAEIVQRINSVLDKETAK